MAPKVPSPRLPRRRGQPSPKRTMDKFGRPLPASPRSAPPIDPNTLLAARLAEEEANNTPDSPQTNAAIIAAQAEAAATSGRRRIATVNTNPNGVRAVINIRGMPPYNIEEEDDDARLNQFFVDSFQHIRDDIAEIASRFFGRHYSDGGADERSFFKGISRLLTPTLRAYINFLADGDIGGHYEKDGWKSIFRDGQEREYLFRGILHRWIEDNVFAKMLLGSTEEQENIYNAQENCFISRDGYVRNRLRSETTIAVLSEHPLPPKFTEDCEKLAETLTKELYPIHALLRPHYNQDYRGAQSPDTTDASNIILRTKLMRGPPYPPANVGDPEKEALALKKSLRNLIQYAGYVHVVCRRSRNIVQIVPAFRGTPFDPVEHMSDPDGEDYYRASKAIVEASPSYREEKQAPSSFLPGIDPSNPPQPSTFPVASTVRSPTTGDTIGTMLQYVPYQPANALLRVSGPILSTAAGAGFGMVGTYLAYTFDIDLPFGEGVWRGFAALPSHILQGAGVGGAIGLAASLPNSGAVALAGSAAGFMMGAVMGVISEQGEIYHWNWTPDFDDLTTASWTRKKALYSGALAGALAAGVIRWVKRGIVVPNDSRAFYPQGGNMPFAAYLTTVGVPLLTELTSHLAGLGQTAVADFLSQHTSLNTETLQLWMLKLRELLTPLVSSGSAAYLSTTSDWSWLRLITSTALGFAGGSAVESFANGKFVWPADLNKGGYMSTLPASLVAAMIATATATSMRYRHSVTQPRTTDIPPRRFPHYRCMTRIGVTPGVRLYKPGDGSDRPNARFNGQRVYEVQKATVLCYWGTENFGFYEGRQKILLDDFLNNYTAGSSIGLGSLFSPIGSIFKASTVGDGENLIQPPGSLPGLPFGPAPGAGLGAGGGGGGGGGGGRGGDSGDGDDGNGDGDGYTERERSLLAEREIYERELEAARQEVRQARREARAGRPAPGAGAIRNLGSTLRRGATATANKIGDSYRVTKNFVAARRPRIRCNQGWLKNTLLTAAGVGVVALAVTGSFYALPRAGQFAEDMWGSVRPNFTGLGRSAGDRLYSAGDKVHSAYDRVQSGLGEGFESGAGIVKDRIQSGKSAVKGQFDAVGSGARKAKDRFEAGTSAAKDRFEAGKSAAKEQFDAVESGARKAKDRIVSGSSDIKERFDSGVKDYLKAEREKGGKQGEQIIQHEAELYDNLVSETQRKKDKAAKRKQEKETERKRKADEVLREQEEKEAERKRKADAAAKEKEAETPKKKEEREDERRRKVDEAAAKKAKKAEEAARKKQEKYDERKRKADEAAAEKARKEAIAELEKLDAEKKAVEEKEREERRKWAIEQELADKEKAKITTTTKPKTREDKSKWTTRTRPLSDNEREEHRREAEELKRREEEAEEKLREAERLVKEAEEKKRAAAAAAKKVKVTPFKDPDAQEPGPDSDYSKNPKKRVYDTYGEEPDAVGKPPPYEKPRKTFYEWSLLNDVGYRGGDNAKPGEPRAFNRPKLSAKKPVRSSFYEPVEETEEVEAPPPPVKTGYQKRPKKSQEKSSWSWFKGREETHEESILREVGYRGGDNAKAEEPPAAKRPKLSAKKPAGDPPVPEPVEEEVQAPSPPPDRTGYQARPKKTEESSWASWFKRNPADYDDDSILGNVDYRGGDNPRPGPPPAPNQPKLRKPKRVREKSPEPVEESERPWPPTETRYTKRPKRQQEKTWSSWFGRE